MVLPLAVGTLAIMFTYRRYPLAADALPGAQTEKPDESAAVQSGPGVPRSRLML